MDSEIVTILFAAIAVLLGCLTTLATRPGGPALRAALAGGMAVSLFDVFGVVLAHRMDWWHLKGAWMVGPVPMVLNAGWIFLGGAYCLVWNRRVAARSFAAQTAVLLATAAYGPINDALLMRLGVFSLGEGMRLPYTFPYWLLCILITLGMFRLALKRQS